jgi:hypothetical protein
MSPLRSDGLFRRSVVPLGLLCALIAGLVFIERGVSAWRVANIAPGTAMTSGGEQESLFAIWRPVHGQPTYVNPTEVPYAAAYFNWLFYATYTQAAKVAVHSHGDAAIAKVGRLASSVGAVVGALLLFYLLRKARQGSVAIAAGVASFVFFGPLVGWWAITVRPDICALAFEAAATVLLLTGYSRRPTLTVLGAAVLFYAAWAFKQTSIAGLATALLFLLVRRQWRLVAILAATSIALWAITFVTLGSAYRSGVLHGGTVSNFNLAIGWMNLTEMLKKTFPLWVLAAPAIFHRGEEANDAPSLEQDMRLWGRFGLLVTLPLAFAGSCKVGASSNYYFGLQFMLALLSTGPARSGLVKMVTPAALSAAVALQFLVATGRLGSIDLLPQAREHAASWSVWKKEPEPRFSVATAFNQPWLNPGSPPFVLAFNYGIDRAAGRAFESGGIGGLIEAGYFRSLLLPAETIGTFDGGRLRLYTRGETIEGNLAIFRRTNSP